MRKNRRNTGTGLSYATLVSAAFVFTSALTVLILVGVLAIVWQTQFQTYTKESIEGIAERTARSIGYHYDDYGYWASGVTDSAVTALDIYGGIGIQVLDGDDNVIMDSTWIMDGNENSQSVSLAPPGSHMVQAPIYSDDSDKRVGTVRVWAYGSDVYLTPRDIEFRNNSYNAIGLAAVVAIVLALILGLVFSRTLVSPVKRIAETANKIKDGDLEARTNLTGTDEISQLGETFDAMAQSIQNDRELERRLTTDVAHELRTPLMAILSTVEAMQDGVLPADSERLAILADESKRLSRLVDALLKLSRLESGAIPFEFKEVDAIELTRSIALSHEALINDSGLKLNFKNSTGRDELICELDRDKIRQATINLMSNAVRYTNEGGEITVEIGLEKNKNMFWIAVSDTGIGIKEDDLNNVFSRFWRAEESRTRVSGGLGIGLSVTKGVVDRHHGYIDVESEFGKGTTFKMHLPCKQPKQNDETNKQENKEESTDE